MKFNNMYIISWFGDNQTTQKRIEIHDRQLQWAFTNGLRPVVFAQHYKDEYYRENVEYIKHAGQLMLPGEARNALLKHFYNSDEDYAIFSDNDCYLYKGEKYGANDHFVSTFRKIPFENLANIDLFTPLDPSNKPFTKELAENKTQDEVRWRFSPAFIAQGIFVLKNLRKHHGLEIYFDDAFVKSDRTILACEDQDFPINMIYNNLGTFTLNNIIKKEEAASSNSTWIGSAKEERWARTVEGLDFIAKKYKLPKQSEAPRGAWTKEFKRINKKLVPTKVYLNAAPTLESLFDE